MGKSAKNFIFLYKYQLFVVVLVFFVSACSKPVGQILSSDLAAIESAYIYAISQDTNSAALVKYDLEGQLIAIVTDFRTEVGYPRGLVYFDPTTFFVAVDQTDSIHQVNPLTGEKSLFHGSALFNGAVYQARYSPQQDKVYAIESNRIEVFDSSGTRLASDYITTTIGACVLSAPRGMIINSAGQLVVTDQADRIMTYDITDTSCVSSSALGSNLNPYGLIEHSDGNLYFVTQQDDSVYRADLDGSNITEIWTPDLAIIRDPTAIIELPNGNLLISSSYTDSLEEITTEGNRVGSEPFIRDSSSLNISDMLVVTEAE